MKSKRYAVPNIALTEEDYDKIKEVFESGWVTAGKYVRQLEELCEHRFGVKYAVACCNATVGLMLAMKAANWRNKAIALPAFTWPSTLFALESCQGCRPVFCDINEETWDINLDTAVSPFDGAIAVDIFGSATAKLDTDVPVIYDAAHGFDLETVGHRGLAEVISFSFTKIVTATEGGMILTNDDRIYEVVKELTRLAGRMEEVNAIVAIASIKNLDESWGSQRIKIMERYETEIITPHTTQEIPIHTNNSVFALKFDSSKMKNDVADQLHKAGYETKHYYDPLITGLPVTDEVFSTLLALPVHPEMMDHQSEIISCINSAITAKPTPGKAYLQESGYIKRFFRGEDDK